MDMDAPHGVWKARLSPVDGDCSAGQMPVMELIEHRGWGEKVWLTGSASPSRLDCGAERGALSTLGCGEEQTG